MLPQRRGADSKLPLILALCLLASCFTGPEPGPGPGLGIPTPAETGGKGSPPGPDGAAAQEPAGAPAPWQPLATYENWTGLGRFQQGTWWYGVVSLGHKKGYAKLTIDKQGDTTRIHFRKRLYDYETTQIREGWFNYGPRNELRAYTFYQKDEKLARMAYAWVLPDNKLQVIVNDVAPDTAIGERPDVANEKPLSREGEIRNDPIPDHILGVVAMILPKRANLIVRAGTILDLGGTVDFDGYFHVVGRTSSYLTDRNVPGWLILYFNSTGWVRQTFLVDDYGNLVVMTRAAGLWYEEHMILESNAVRALNGTPDELVTDPEDLAIVPEAPTGKASEPQPPQDGQ